MRHLVLVAVACSIPALAQTKLMTFEVVALDNHGQSVPGLTADDFQVADRGKHFRISVFRSSRTATEPEPPALASDEYSNRSAEPAPSGVRVILFDTLNPIDARFARNQLASALHEYGSDEHLYLYFLTPLGLQPVRGLPHAHGGTATISLDDVSVEQAYQNALKANVDSYGWDSANMTYRSLQSLASRLASFAGRKSIIWISRGVPISNASQLPEYAHDYSRLFAETNLAMQRAKVAVYAVGDARREIGSESMGVLGEMAEATGGRLHLDLGVAAAIKEATADGRLTYTIGYFPGTWDDKVHKLRIVCTRSGVHLLAPTGYLAEAQRATPAARERTAIETAARSSLESGEIGIHAVMERDEKQPDLRRFRIRLNARDLRFYRQDEGERYEGNLSITVVAYDAAGRPSPSDAIPYLFHMKPDMHEAAIQGGLNVSAQRALDGSTDKVRVIVFDRYSNAVGSVTIPIAASVLGH